MTTAEQFYEIIDERKKIESSINIKFKPLLIILIFFLNN